MATRTTAKPSVLEQLRAPFPVEDVKQRPGGGGKQLDYVAIETVLARLLDVAPDYAWEGRVVSIEDGTAVVEGHLTIEGKRAFGVGAMKNPDLDMAVKSANSEAMKNAAKNGFGVSLELWSADYRAQLDRARTAGKSVASMKQEVFRIAKGRLDKASPTAKDVAGVFGVSAGSLGDEDTLREILQKEGIL